MTNLFARIYALDNPDAPLPPGLDISSREPSPVNAENLQPIKNWSHPFRDKRDPLMQLTHLAKAGGGFYPLAGNGLWHGGVHFDGGTAGTGDQSSVHCLADGEVVAYRIDTLSPTTTYWINKLPVRRPFSRNFVLVRHRLQAPAIEGNKDTPPSLIFYSLYMHLQDWVQYDTDPTITRPPFWSEGSTRYVKDTVNDERVGHPGVKGLNIRHLAQKGQVIGLLPRGAKVQVSGEGAFRRLENTPGPEHLVGEDGALRGYVAAEHLVPMPGGYFRVNTKNPLNIRPQPDTLQAPIGELFRDTEVAVSGTGTFLKLERINQYVHYDSLQGKQEPKAFDSVVVLDKPVPIKAGDLIGHIGAYQEAHADRPENKLHLEVFTSEPVESVIKRFRTWESKLPASGRTWLKLVKGTPVVRHQERYSAEQPPSLHHDSTPSDGQLLVPKTLLDGLPAACKIAVPEKDGRKACNWYRLDKLLHDSSQTLLDGWVREEVGVTPWVSPWAWEGFDTLFNFDPPEHLMASFMRATGRLNDIQRARYRATADRVDKGPIQERLYDLIDRNRDGKVTGSEIQTALNLPAHAQSIAQLIVHSDSEWHHTPRKWDALDELLGHSGSTPNKNWLAEKERIKEMSWWEQVAPGVGLPGHGGVYHLHPVGLANWFRTLPTCILLTDAIALALIVSGGYEGRSNLDYHALADDFDGQGTSFGLIQWNFGQGTLGKLLLKMLQLDSAAFEGSFPANTQYEELKYALLSSNVTSQMEWARNIIRNNRIGWKKAFTGLGDVEAFQKVQLREAARFHDNVEGCVVEMRRLVPSLMATVELRTYVALYDMCVQQGGLSRGKTLENIKVRLEGEEVHSQKDLLKICVHERAKTASHKWAADCLSRRMGIIAGSSQAVELYGVKARRANANFTILDAYEGKHVCEV